MQTTGYDVTAVRAQFPALAEGAAHFDGPGGSQTPLVVADAVAGTLRSAMANQGSTTLAEQRAAGIVRDARSAVADLLAADPGGVVFGQSMTALCYKIAYTLARGWHADDEVVVTRLDHDGHIRPWVQAAELAGATVRWAEFDPETGELPVSAVTDLLSDRTRLVAVTAASNLLGTCPDLPAIGRAVHDAGALFSVDGVHYTPHAVVDVGALGADFYFCSAYKFFGPHIGLLAAAPELLESLHPDKLRPQSDLVPGRFEWGTLPYELLAGVTAAVDFIAGLQETDGSRESGGSRRDRLAVSLGVVGEHETRLRDELEARLAEIPGLRLYGHAARRTPTSLFTVDGIAPQAIYEALATRGVNAPAGSFYAYECALRLGLADTGAVRAGLAPYTHDSDLDRLVTGVRELVAG